MIQKTSIEAFNELTKEDKLSKDCIKVFGALLENELLTDTEIAQELGEEDPVNSKMYRPRRTELVELGLVCQHGTKRSSLTGKSNIVWGIKKNYTGPQETKELLSNTQMIKVKKLVSQMNEHQKQMVRSWL